MRTYCDRKGIDVIAHYQDDHSAKTFDRPEFQKLLVWLRANKRACDAVLFVKWDRFSRNATDALNMIRTLEQLGVEPQAIEQPIDWHVPEQLMMLAIYVASPEVENRRRSIAVKQGMRRAMMEGRYCYAAPFGYRRERRDDGKSYLVHDENRAPVVRKAFALAAERPDLQMEEIRQRLQPEGLTISKMQFTTLLRNPLYAGMIQVPEWKDEPEEIVQGIHEAIVPWQAFQKVQQRFEAPARGRGTTREIVPEIYLRGHLVCNQCNELLTGAGNRGRTRRYWYYHCHRCQAAARPPVRHKAPVVNDRIGPWLSGLELADEVKVYYDHVIRDLSQSERAARRRRIGQVRRDLDDLEERLFKVDEKYIEGEIAPDSYKRLKAKYMEKVAETQSRLEALTDVDGRFSEQLEFAVHLLSNLRDIYDASALDDRRAILVQMFPEHLMFSDATFEPAGDGGIIGLFGPKTHKNKGLRFQKSDAVQCGGPGLTHLESSHVHIERLFRLREVLRAA